MRLSQFPAINIFHRYSYSFKDAKWSCGAGFALAKVTNVSFSGGGGVVYEMVTLY